MAEEKRDVTKCLDKTASSELEVEQRVSSLFQSLASPRVAVRSSLNQAEWDEERGQVIVTRNCGKQERGPLNPEEALFLLENNCLHLTRSEVPLSLQAAYTFLLSHTDLTLGKSSTTPGKQQLTVPLLLQRNTWCTPSLHGKDSNC